MKRASLWLLATTVAACATAPTGNGANRQIEVDSHSLAGEIAIDRQDFGTAAREFLAAARLSDEPALAERATRIAHQLELNDPGLEAARRWRELAPEDERPAWFAGVFETRANRLPRAVAEFETFIRSVSDQRTAFALVLEALSDEPYATASTAIMQALNETFPNVPTGQYALARLALRSGNFELALPAAAAAAASDPDWLEAQLLHARTLLVAGRSEESLAIGARLSEQHDEIEVQLQYAELLLSAGRPREAETRLNDILAKSPGLPEATRALAFLAMTEQRGDDAKRFFNDLRGEPRYRSEAFYYLGRLAEDERNFLEATRSYARVTDGTHAVEAQLRTARIMFAEQGDREGAVRHLRDFGAANPRFSSEMLVAQSQLLLQMEQPEQALALITDALAETPDDPGLHFAHVQLYILLAENASERGSLDEAERLLNEGLARYKNHSSLRYSLALLYEDQRRPRKAVDLLQGLVKDYPDDPAFLNALGYLLTDQFNRHEEARDYIQRALAMNPDSAAIIDSMGWVLFKLGDYQAAADYLERAYRLEPGPEIGSHVVEVRWQLGDRENARELLQTLREQYPNDRYVKDVTERLAQ